MSEFAKVAANMASVAMEPLQTGSAQSAIRAGKKRQSFSQETFSENDTKITLQSAQIHIRNFETLHFLDNISKITMIQNSFCLEKCTTSIKGKVALWN